MAFTATTNLSLPLIDTGTESGTWGELVDNGLTSYLDIAIAGGLAITITTADVTLTKTAGTSSATGIISTGLTGSTAQYAILNVSGAMTAARSLILPSSSKTYIINNACTGGYVLTIKGAATTGITLRNSESAQVAWNGSDFVKVGPGASITGTNTVIGKNALERNTTGNTNTAIGYQALTVNSTGGGNSAIGSNALSANTTGIGNTAVGYAALNANVSNSYNTAVGNGSQQLSNGGLANTSIGYTSLNVNVTGDQNTASGYQSMFRLDGGSWNTASGHNSAYNLTTGASNAAFGESALSACVTGGWNAAFGRLALSSGTGVSNTAIGSQSGNAITTGSGNITIGGQTSASVVAPAYSITTESNYISMGSTSVTNAYVQVAWTVVSDARDKTDFAEVPHGLDFVSKLQPTAYRYKENRDATEGHGPVRYGFKAQDVLALEGDAPVIVDADNPDKLYFNDQALLAVLVNAIKELKAEFDAYKATHP